MITVLVKSKTNINYVETRNWIRCFENVSLLILSRILDFITPFRESLLEIYHSLHHQLNLNWMFFSLLHKNRTVPDKLIQIIAQSPQALLPAVGHQENSGVVDFYYRRIFCGKTMEAVTEQPIPKKTTFFRIFPNSRPTACQTAWARL